MNADFKLQILHSGQIFDTSEEALKYIEKYLEDGILLAEPAVAFYGDDKDHPNVILCVGNGTEKNSVYTVDFQGIKDELKTLSDDGSANAEELAEAMAKIEGILDAVGLSCNEINGEWVVSYEPDPKDEVIGDAESVADALAKLSEYAQSVAEDSQFDVEDTDSIELVKENAVIKATLKVSKLGETSITDNDDNIIGVFSDGVYAVAHLDYDDEKKTLTFTTSGYDSNGDFKRDANKEVVNLGEHTLYEEYNKGHDVEVTVDNEEMKISADVKISDGDDNILVSKSDGLLVKGTASNIKYHNTTVREAINDLYDKVTDAAKKTEYNDTDTVKFTTTTDSNDELNVTADVKLASNNSINVADGGLNVNLKITVNQAENTLTVKLGDVEETYDLPGVEIIDSIEFKDGNLVIHYGNGKEVTVPLEGLIAHYVFSNDDSHTVHLDADMDSSGVYTVTASVKLRSSDNLIEVDDKGELYVSKETVEAIVSGVSDDIIERVKVLEEKVEALEKEDISIKDDIETLKEKVDTNTTNIQTNTDAISAIQTQMATDETSLKAIQAQVETNTADIATNTSNITDIQNQLATDETSLKAIQAQVETNTADIATNTSNITDIQNQLATDETSLKAIQAQVETNTANISANTSDIADIKTQVATDESNFSSLAEQVKTNEANIQTNADAISALQDEVKEVESEIKLDEQTIENLTSEVKDVENTVAEVQTEVSTNTSNIATLTTRTDTLDEEVATLNADADTVGSVQHTVKVAKDIVEEELSTETTRATTAEEGLQSQIDSLSAQLSGDEESILAAAKEYTDKETERATAAEEALQTSVDTINGEIETINTELDKKIETVTVQRINDLQYQILVDGQPVEAMIDIPDAIILASSEYDPTSHHLKLIFKTDTGEQDVDIDLTDLLDVYEAGDGLKLDGATFNVHINPLSEEYLFVDGDGLYIKGIDAALDTKANASDVDTYVNDLTEKIQANTDAIDIINGGVDTEGSIKNAVAEAESYTDEKVQTATDDLQAQITTNTDAIAVLNGNEAEEGSVKNAIAVSEAYTDDKVSELEEKISEVANEICDAGDGLEKIDVEGGHKFNIHINTAANAEGYLKLDSDGLYVSGIDNAVSEAVATETTRAQEAENALQEQVTTNTDAIAVLNGNEAQEGSVQNAIKTSKDYTDEQVSGAQTALQEQIDELSSQLSGDETSILEEAKSYTDEKLETVKIEKVDSNDLQYQLLVDGKNAGYINIPEDAFLKSVYYDESIKALVFDFLVKEDDGTTKEEIVNIPISDMVSDYTSGEGITIKDNVVSIHINSAANEKDADGNAYLSLTEDGLALLGINEALALKADQSYVDEQVNELNERISTLEGTEYTAGNGIDITDLTISAKINDDANTEGYLKIGDGGLYVSGVDSAISETVTSASDALQSQIDENKSAIDTLNGGVDTEGSVKNAIATAEGYTDEKVSDLENQISEVASELCDAGDGLKKVDIEGGHKFEVHINENSQDYLTVGEDGLNLKGVAGSDELSAVDERVKTIESDYATSADIKTVQDGVDANASAIEKLSDNFDSYKFHTADTTTVALAMKESEGTETNRELTANVKISSSTENIVKDDGSGIFVKTTFDYNAATNTITFNNGGTDQTYVLSFGETLLKDGKWDAASHSLILTVEDGSGNEHDITIPITDLIDFLSVDNENGEPVDLILNTDANGKYVLSATLKLSTGDNNALQKDDGGLYVSNLADYLYTHDQEGTIISIEKAISGFYNDITSINNTLENLESEVGDVTEIAKEVSQNTSDIAVLKTDVALNTASITLLQNSIDSLTTSISNINSKLDSIEGTLTSLTEIADCLGSICSSESTVADRLEAIEEVIEDLIDFGEYSE